MIRTSLATLLALMGTLLILGCSDLNPLLAWSAYREFTSWLMYERQVPVLLFLLAGYGLFILAYQLDGVKDNLSLPT